MFLMSDILKDSPESTSYCPKDRMKCIQTVNQFKSSENIERSLIRQHPLYPTLKALAIRCQRATIQPDFDAYDTKDIMKGLRSLQSKGQGIDTENSLVDSLMISAVLEMRRQLKELEQLTKKADLCRMELNESLKKAQNKMAKIMQNEFQDDQPIFKIPKLKRPNGFRIVDLLADTPSGFN